jgi:hypothetical protein
LFGSININPMNMNQVSALLFIINGADVSRMEKHDAVQSVPEFFQHNCVKYVGLKHEI